MLRVRSCALRGPGHPPALALGWRLARVLEGLQKVLLCYSLRMLQKRAGPQEVQAAQLCNKALTNAFSKAL